MTTWSAYSDNNSRPPGVMTQAFRALFGRGKANEGVIMDAIPYPTSFDGKLLKPGAKVDYRSAYKGLIYTCTDIRAEALGMLPLRVYRVIDDTNSDKKLLSMIRTREVPRKKQELMIAKAQPGTRLSMAENVEEVLSGPLVDLLRNVNNTQLNSFDLKHLTSSYLDLTGNCYWVLIRNNAGVPSSIWVIPPDNMEVIPDQDNFIKGYKYKRGKKEIIYKSEDIVHFKYVTVRSQFYGDGRLIATIDSHDLRAYMIQFEHQMFKTGGIPKQILMAKGNVSPEIAERIKQGWKDTKMGDIAVVGNAEFDLVEPKSVTARDMGYSEGLDWTRDDIAQIFRIPKSMLTTNDVNLANANAGERQFAKRGIAPAAVRIDQKITEQLAPQFDDDLIVLFDNPVEDDAESVREDKKLNIEMGIVSRNEVRTVDGLETIEGGDELLVPNNLVPISQVGQQMSEQQAAFVAGRATEIARARR